MAANTNAVAAFYADGTYKLVTWDRTMDLQGTKLYVGLAVYHVQPPATVPGAVVFLGHDGACVMRVGGGLIACQADFPPWPRFARRWWFEEGGVQQISQDVLGPLHMIFEGSHTVFLTKNYDEAAYNAMTDRVNTKAPQLATAAVPSEGTY